MITNTLLFTSLVVIASVASFKIPRGIKDGVYLAYYNSSGVEVHRPLQPSDLKRRSEPLQIKRQVTDPGVWTTWCGCGIELDHGNCDAAVADLKAQVGTDGVDIQRLQSVFSIRGNAVAFACNNGNVDPIDQTGGPTGVNADLITASAGQVTSACGLYIAGTAEFSDFAPTDSPMAEIGYMVFTDGLDFCANSDTSAARSC